MTVGPRSHAEQARTPTQTKSGLIDAQPRERGGPGILITSHCYTRLVTVKEHYAPGAASSIRVPRREQLGVTVQLEIELLCDQPLAVGIRVTIPFCDGQVALIVAFINV